MRCPKCRYLSFEPEARCRNCGYDLSFGIDDLLIDSPDATSEPLADFDLRGSDASRAVEEAAPASATSFSFALDADRAAPVSESRRAAMPLTVEAASAVLDIEQAIEAPSTDEPARESSSAFLGEESREDVVPVLTPAVEPAPASAPELPTRRPARPPETTALPLFVQELPQPDPDPEEIFRQLARTARPPLAVRRPTPDTGRLRATYQRPAASARPVGPIERDLLDFERQEPAAQEVTVRASAVLPSSEATPDRLPEQWRVPVRPTKRLEAALVDVLFIGAINIVLVWLTLHRCDLALSQTALLPMLPLAAFLLLVDAGYLLMFTAAGGQTVGKMMTHIRVVGTSAHAVMNDRVTFRQAAIRTLMTIPSVLVLGAGFFPALVGDGRAIHDRCAHTRVVRA